MVDNESDRLEGPSARDALRRMFRRKVIVLSDKNPSRPLNVAIKFAKNYQNDSGENEVEFSHGSDEGWRWSEQFQEAKTRPNTFIALEDGSVLQRNIVELEQDLRVISSMGGGLSFGHQSNALFRKLGARFCVLADDPLDNLLNLLSVNKQLNEMNLLVPVHQKDTAAALQESSKTLLRSGVSLTEVSRRLGVNRSTIYRWKKTWGKNGEA